ncbi:MAG TPA: RidA family protein [Actinomycetota bacterium]|nr:RidA family protein [Actinomycetota bacterium]
MAYRNNIRSGSPFEDRIGFSRAVRVGNRVLVSGTAPIWEDGSVDPDPYVQAKRCLEIIVQALAEAGASAADVVRTRTYLTDAGYGAAVAQAHVETFGGIRPTSTMIVVAALLDDRWKVEFEAEAMLNVDETSFEA